MSIKQKTTRYIVSAAVVAILGVFTTSAVMSALITDPNDPRSWQGATVGTFAALYYGADTLANRQLVVDNKLLDDGLFDDTGATAAVMISTTGVINNPGRSLDTTGTGSYAYDFPGISINQGGDLIDNLWVQTDNVIGHAVWDLGAPSTKAAIFNTIDHGPLPQEAIEATVYLSNDPTFASYTEAVTERVWLEGFDPILGILWDGFTYAVGTGTEDTFQYASIIWGGPGALISDGDNEINGVLGLDSDFTPTDPGVPAVPVPAAVWLFGTALVGFIGVSRRRKVA
jgi:hypothetical protein